MHAAIRVRCCRGALLSSHSYATLRTERAAAPDDAEVVESGGPPIKPKGSGAGRGEGTGFRGKERGGRKRQRDFLRKPGDWDCSQCPAVTFASRDKCHKCGAPKPPGAGGGWEKPASAKKPKLAGENS